MKKKSSALPPIINFAAIDFWYHNRAHSEIQLMTRLSKSTKVLFINSIGMRAPLPGRSTKSGFRIKRKIKSLFRGLRTPLGDFPDFYVYSPLIIPAYSTPLLRKINYFIVRIQVRILMVILKISKPIIFETIPTSNDIAKKLPCSLEIINRVDKMSAFGETNQQYIADLEQQQILRADRVYYTSQVLLEEEKRLHNSKGIFLDHGVDLELFKIQSTKNKPEEFQDIKTPVLGFFGGIDDYVIDLDLVEQIANEFCQCTVVLIGEPTCDISSITNHDNVVFFGFRPIQEVAKLGAFFDVALLPRKNDEWTKYTNPIKIKEYLALGLNVVTIAIPEVQKYSNDLYIAENKEEFINKISEALKSKNDRAHREHLRSLVISDTWDHRCEEVVDDMKELLSCAG